MRLLGIDPGSRRCGIAVSDSAETLAFPRTALVNDDDLLMALRRLVDEELVGGIVIGRPVALSGNSTPSTGVATELHSRLVVEFPEIAVVQWDERLTTVEAQRSLQAAGISSKHQRNHVDSASAVIMLQNYLDARRAH